MSLMDQVRKLEGQVVERLKELQPLIGEYTQLRKLAERLGIHCTPSTEDTAAPAAPARRKSAAKKSTEPGRSAAKKRTAHRTTAKSAAKRAGRTRAAGAARARSAGQPATAAKAAPRSATPARTSARRSRGRKAAPTRPGRRTQDMLRVVGEQPGISVREIGERLGVDATGLYRVANKLTADGRLRKDGTGLYVVEPGAATQPQTAVKSAQRTATDTGAQPSSPG